MDYQIEWQKEVKEALAPYQWETDYLAIMYVLCDLRIQGDAGVILENVLHHRWGQRRMIPPDPPVLQMGPFELPVTAFYTPEWRAVIDEMLERKIIKELTAREAEALEKGYRESGAACAPLDSYSVGDLALTVRGKDDFRSLLDSGVFGYLFCPAYGIDEETTFQIFSEERYRKLQEDPFTDSCEQQVGQFWETPFHLVNAGIGLRYLREEMNRDNYEIIFRDCDIIPGKKYGSMK